MGKSEKMVKIKNYKTQDNKLLIKVNKEVTIVNRRQAMMIK